MDEILARLRSDDIVGLAALVLTFLAGMTVWLSLQWRLYRRSETEAALKHAMLERGMSAEEIERVMRAGRDPLPEPSDADRVTESHRGRD
jgi:hypothetical protein